MSKQKITKFPDFCSLSIEDQYCNLRDTEYRVQRLERIIEGLVVWKENSPPYKDVIQEYEDYLGELND